MPHDGAFDGARVLVTGAAAGLGAALADAFAARGASVLRTDLRPDGAVHRLDVTSPDDWRATRAHVEREWGGLDVLVNNAGVAGGGRLERCGLDAWRRLIEVNLLGLVEGTRTFAPLLRAAPAGRLVNVASLAGLVHPAGLGSYNAVKAAVVAFTETVGHELAADGVTAHAVCPSYLRTGLADSMEVEDTAVAAVVRRLVEQSPVSAAEVAAATLDALLRGEELVLPDEAGRAAYALRTTDRPAYDALLRRQAAGLEGQA